MRAQLRKIYLIFLFTLISTSFASAQMFSQSDKGSFRLSDENKPYSALLISVNDVFFENVHNSLEAGLSGYNQWEFEGKTIGIAFENDFSRFSIDYGSGLSGLDDFRYFSLQLSPWTNFGFIKTKGFELGIPFGADFNLVRAYNEIGNNNRIFNQNSISLLSGAYIIIDQNKWALRLSGKYSYGLSYTEFSGQGGSRTQLDLPIRFTIKNMMFGKDITLGYLYTEKEFDLDSDEFDYKLSQHQFSLGFSF